MAARSGKLWGLLTELLAVAPALSGWVQIWRRDGKEEIYRGVIVSKFRYKGNLTCLLLLIPSWPERKDVLLWGASRMNNLQSDATTEYPAITRYTACDLGIFESTEDLYVELREISASFIRGVAKVGRERIRAAAEFAGADRLLIQGYCGEPVD